MQRLILKIHIDRFQLDFTQGYTRFSKNSILPVDKSGNLQFEDYLHPYCTSLTRLSSLKPQEVSGHKPLNKRAPWQMKQGGWLGKCWSWPMQIKASGSQKLLVQLVLPTACTRGCFETSNTYLPDQAKAIGLRIMNMCVNFLVFQCYFLRSTPLGKYRILILKKLSWMSKWFGDSTKLLKTNL